MRSIGYRGLCSGIALLALAACHQPTGRVSEGGGTFTPPPSIVTGTPGPSVIEGTPGDDLLTGTDGDDVICGGACPDNVTLPRRAKGEW